MVAENKLGRTSDGLARGGSDYTAALLAEGLYTHLVDDIWTDVRASYTSPIHAFRILQQKRIDEIAFPKRQRWSSDFGAKVLHPEATLLPSQPQRYPSLCRLQQEAHAAGGTLVCTTENPPPLFRARPSCNRDSAHFAQPEYAAFSRFPRGSFPASSRGIIIRWTNHHVRSGCGVNPDTTGSTSTGDTLLTQSLC